MEEIKKKILKILFWRQKILSPNIAEIFKNGFGDELFRGQI